MIIEAPDRELADIAHLSDSDVSRIIQATPLQSLIHQDATTRHWEFIHKEYYTAPTKKNYVN